MKIEMTSVGTLKPYAGNARTHSKKQVRQIAKSIERFGFCNPVLIDDERRIIAGHGRVEAAKLLKLISPMQVVNKVVMVFFIFLIPLSGFSL